MAELGSIISKATNDTDPLNSPNHNTQHGYMSTALNLGWVQFQVSFTWVSSDDPTYVIKTDTDVDLTSELSAGMRLKITHSSAVKYFIITAVDYNVTVASRTCLTLYGGTDYDLSNSALSAPFYSMVKAPSGFPLDPTKWEILVTDSTTRNQATPSNSTWYNIGTTNSQITIPIGTWDVWYQVAVYVYGSTEDYNVGYSTLSTANNSESDTSMTAIHYDDSVSEVINVLTAQRTLTLSSKTLYYLNGKGTVAGTLNGLSFYNSDGGGTYQMKIRARSVYL